MRKIFYVLRHYKLAYKLLRNNEHNELFKEQNKTEELDEYKLLRENLKKMRENPLFIPD